MISAPIHELAIRSSATTLLEAKSSGSGSSAGNPKAFTC
jgi:hypothetical protein